MSYPKWLHHAGKNETVQINTPEERLQYGSDWVRCTAPVEPESEPKPEQDSRGSYVVTDVTTTEAPIKSVVHPKKKWKGNKA
jgi:hypothetical protein